MLVTLVLTPALLPSSTRTLSPRPSPAGARHPPPSAILWDELSTELDASVPVYVVANQAGRPIEYEPVQLGSQQAAQAVLYSQPSRSADSTPLSLIYADPEQSAPPRVEYEPVALRPQGSKPALYEVVESEPDGGPLAVSIGGLGGRLAARGSGAGHRHAKGPVAVALQHSTDEFC